MAVMKLYDEGKLDIQKTLGDYLPWVRGTNKDSLKIWDVFASGRIKSFIPFYKETIDSIQGGIPLSSIYSWKQDSLHMCALRKIYSCAMIGWIRYTVAFSK